MKLKKSQKLNNCQSLWGIIIKVKLKKKGFFGFTPLKYSNAIALFNLSITLNVLSKYRIDTNKCVAQTDYGTNVMRGSMNSVQALYKIEVPQAMYIHCNNHRLNLIFVDVVKNVEVVDYFF